MSNKTIFIERQNKLDRNQEKKYRKVQKIYVEDGNCSIQEACDRAGISKSTYYTYAAKFNKRKSNSFDDTSITSTSLKSSYNKPDSVSHNRKKHDKVNIELVKSQPESSSVRKSNSSVRRSSSKSSTLSRDEMSVYNELDNKLELLMRQLGKS
jgi:transposase